MDRIDLRAHIGATTSLEADRGYKDQATAYLDFHAAKILSLKDDRRVARADASNKQALPAIDATQYNDVDTGLKPSSVSNETTYIEDTQLAITALDSQLFSLPAQPARINLRKRTLQHVEAAVDDQQRYVCVSESTSDEAPNSNSSHLKTPVFYRPAKRRRTGSDGAIARCAEVATSPTKASPSWAGPAVDVLPDNAGGSDAQDIGENSTSELPTTYSLSDIVSDKTKSDRSVQRSVSDPGPSVTAVADVSTESESHSSASRRRSLQPDATSPATAVAIQVRHDVGVARADVTDAGTRQTVWFIRAPPPEVSVASFQSHISARLRSLADAPQITGVYRPKHVERELLPLERGHWLFSDSSWSTSLKTSFWSFLDAFISQGGAGWGVWCVWTSNEVIDGQKKDVIRTYCWGEVVKHIYLLLYIASQSKVRKLGLQWIDAGGEVVVQMRDQ